MGLNIKDVETERLAAEVASLAGETKTRAIKVALQERRERLALSVRAPGGRRERVLRFLEQEAWPQVPARAKGKALNRTQRERILGYGPEGV